MEVVAEPPPQKKMIFCSRNDKCGCILIQFLTVRKQKETVTRSLGILILRFIRKTKLTKIIQKVHSETEGP